MRRLLSEPKSDSRVVDLEFVNKSIEFPKDEETREEVMVDRQLSETYINDSVGYFSNEQNNHSDNDNENGNENDVDKYVDQEIADVVKDEIILCPDIMEIEMKKNYPKQTRKRLKRRTQTQKNQDVESVLASDLEDDSNDPDTKASVKIPDNYMTGNK